jgi:hypothetical protein
MSFGMPEPPEGGLCFDGSGMWSGRVVKEDWLEAQVGRISWLFARIKALTGALFFDVFWRVKLSVQTVEASCVRF